MIKNKIKIPNNWQQVKFDDICQRMTNGFVGKAVDNYTNRSDGVMYIQGYNITKVGYNFHGIKKVTKEFSNKNSKSILQEGDLLTVQTGDVGLTSIVPKSLVGANCHALIISRFKKDLAFSAFFFQYYKTCEGKRQISRIQTGSTMQHVNVGDLKKVKVLLPPLPEQNRIVSVLETWDKGVELLGKKIVLKKQLKKGLMQKLLTGEKRLPGFNNTWNTFEFIDIFDVLKKPFGLKSKDYCEDGEFPIIDQSSVRYVSGYTNDKNSLHDYSLAPVIVFGDHSRVIKFINKKVAFGNDGIKLFSNKSNLNIIFGYYLLLNKRIPETGYNRHFKYFANAVFDIPSLEEQKLIVKVLTASDKEINLLEQKLSELKKQKKYLLNSLITGAIRTPENLKIK